MKLIENDFYVSTSIDEVDIFDDVKFAFDQFTEIHKKHQSQIILFYIDATNGILSIGYAKDDSSYVGNVIAVRFSRLWEENDNVYYFEGAIELATSKVVLSIKDDFDESVRFYYGNDGESGMFEIK